MLLVVAGVAVGVAVGFLGRGSLRRLANLDLRLWWLAVLGFVAQVVPVPARLSIPGVRFDPGAALLIVSYLLLLGFVLANLRTAGFPVMAIGFALNAAVVTANGGMPVGASALRAAAGSGYPTALRILSANGGAKHHLAGPGVLLRPLADVIGVGRPVDAVLSVGDLFWVAGLAWVIAAAMWPPRYRGRHTVEGVLARASNAPDVDRGRELGGSSAG